MIDELNQLMTTELTYASFNAQRTASSLTIGPVLHTSPAGIPYLVDASRPDSEYYNRAVIPANFESLDEELATLPITVQAVELLIPQQTEAVFSALRRFKFIPLASLCYLTTAPTSTKPEHNVVQLRPDQTDDFFDLVELSGASFSPEKRNATRKFYCNDTFRCFVAYDQHDKPAAWATMYVSKDTAFLANAFTLPAFRGTGYHAALLSERVRIASTLGLDDLYTDVQPATQSHRNCQRSGFRLLTVNSIWKRAGTDD